MGKDDLITSGTVILEPRQFATVGAQYDYTLNVSIKDVHAPNTIQYRLHTV